MKTQKFEVIELILFCALFLQLFSGVMLFFWSLQHEKELPLMIIMITKLPVIIASILIFSFSRIMMRVELNKLKEEQETKVQLERSFQLINSLEAQRHDFRNQLQVISSFATMGKNEQLLEYIGECGLALDSLGDLTKLDNAIVQALLLTSYNRMKEMGIKFVFDCGVSLKDLIHSPLKITRIFGNILQNAMEAAMEEKENPIVSVAIWREDEGFFHFVFWNNGPPIRQADLETIFQPGFSTKIGESRGYGLYIVKTLTEELGGRILVHSNAADGTEFHILLPASTKPANAVFPEIFSAGNLGTFV